MNVTPIPYPDVVPEITVDTWQLGAVLAFDYQAAQDESPAAAAKSRNVVITEYHYPIPPTAFFLLACPTTLHLWKPAAPPAALPDETGSVLPLLRAYKPKKPEQVRRVGRSEMCGLVTSWLHDAILGKPTPEAEEADQMLVRAGVYDLLRYGKFRFAP